MGFILPAACDNLYIVVDLILCFISLSQHDINIITFRHIQHKDQTCCLQEIKKGPRMKQWPPSDILHDNKFSLLGFFPYLSSAALNFNYFFTGK